MAAAITVAPAAQAGFGSVGGSHGSSGGGVAASYGSYGGSTGGYAAAAYGSSGGYGAAGYGSSGGYEAGHGHGRRHGHVGPLRRLIHRLHSHRAARAAHGSSGGGYGSSVGGYGSSGGGYASYASSGGGASYGSSVGASYYKSYAAGYGSSGGSSGGVSTVPSYHYEGGVPYDVVPQQQYEPGPGSGYGPGVPQSQTPEGDQAVELGDDQVLMTVSVPETALVQVNGLPTSSTGPIRQFMSKGLKPGLLYKYEVEVLFEGADQPVRRTVKLRAGSTERMVFNATDTDPVVQTPSSDLETVVTVRVPADAKVELAGNETHGQGEVRTFRSRSLADGQRWEDYTIRVTTTVNGSLVSKERTLDLVAGSAHDVSFEFDGTEVASR